MKRQVTAPRTACLAVVAAVCGPALGGASLVGDTIEYWRHPQLTGETILDSFGIVTDPGHEFTVGGAGLVLFTIDVGVNSVRIDSVTDWHSPWFNTGFDPSWMEIRDLDWSVPGTTIVDVIVTFSPGISPESGAPDGMPAFSAANAWFTDDSVAISYGGYAFTAGSWVNVELVTIPAPGAGCVLATLAMLAGRRRR
jgi:hypothetical protein